MKDRQTVFITGSSGFIGKTLLPLFADREKWHVRLLVRDGREPSGFSGSVDVVTGDITEPDSYSAALDGVDQIIHLAAMTGSAAPDVHDRLNRQATEQLIDAARSAGVEHFLLISTIAAGYSDMSFYPYAKAKLAAERALADSGLNFTILRPTLVLGPGSPIWDTLGKLTGLPVLPLPGGFASFKAQPVHVRDVARAIYEVVDGKRYDGEVLEIGGRDVVPMREFLLMIAEARHGRRPKILPLPLKLVQYPLAALEPLARSVMPATAGQFAVFGNDSAARPNWLMAMLWPDMPTLADLIADLVANKKDGGSGGATRPSATVAAPESSDRLHRDADSLARYLGGIREGAGVSGHFAAACAAHGLDRPPRTGAERATIALARRGGFGLWLADGYCGLLGRGSLLHRRMIVMTAILEHSKPAHQRFDRAPGGGAGAAVLRLIVSGGLAGIQSLVGIVSTVSLMIAGRLFGKANDRAA